MFLFSYSFSYCWPEDYGKNNHSAVQTLSNKPKFELEVTSLQHVGTIAEVSILRVVF